MSPSPKSSKPHPRAPRGDFGPALATKAASITRTRAQARTVGTTVHAELDGELTNSTDSR